MKKALIPAAILMLAGAAHAELALYGLIDLSFGQNKITPSAVDNAADNKASFFSGGDGNHGNSVTRFGIKGSTDVGSGIKVNFKLESSGIDSTGDVGSPFFGRQAWAGASGSFGEIRAGRQDSVAFQTMIGFDANGASNVASAWGYAGVAAWGPGRQIGVAQYISPDMGGLKVQVSFQPEGDAKAQAALAQAGTGKANFGLGATYATGPLTLALAAQSKTVEGGEDFTAVAGSYDFGFLKAALTYTDAGDAAKGLGLSVSTTVAGYTMGFQYAKNSEGNKDKAYELFVNKEVLKNTYLYADFGRATIASKSDNAYAIGAIYTF